MPSSKDQKRVIPSILEEPPFFHFSTRHNPRVSMSRETEARRRDFFHAWRKPWVWLPHFLCNRFPAQPLILMLDFRRSLQQIPESASPPQTILGARPLTTDAGRRLRTF